MSRNPNFEYALAWTRRAMPQLFRPELGGIELAPPGAGCAVLGLFRGDCTVIVIDGARSAAEFANTLVHELTHLTQHVEGRAMDESEAIEAGCQAEHAFLMSTTLVGPTFIMLRKREE